MNSYSIPQYSNSTYIYLQCNKVREEKRKHTHICAQTNTKHVCIMLSNFGKKESINEFEKKFVQFKIKCSLLHKKSFCFFIPLSHLLKNRTLALTADPIQFTQCLVPSASVCLSFCFCMTPPPAPPPSLLLCCFALATHWHCSACTQSVNTCLYVK